MENNLPTTELAIAIVAAQFILLIFIAICVFLVRYIKEARFRRRSYHRMEEQIEDLHHKLVVMPTKNKRGR